MKSLRKKIDFLLVCRPDFFWPVNKAKALFALGYEEKALALIHRVLNKKSSYRRMIELNAAWNHAQEQAAKDRGTVWQPIDCCHPFGPLPSPDEFSILPKLDKPEFVLLLPGIFEAAFSAGPNTAFRFAAEVAKLGYRIHCISLQTPACSLNILQNHLVQSLGIEPEIVSRFSLSDMTREVCLHEGDRVCATASWTLPTAVALARRTQTCCPAYFIQDFEPCFLPWGPGHAMLMETYAEDFLPIINTPSLADMLFNVGAGSFADEEFKKRALIFQPAVERSFFYPEPRQSGKRILFVYTRFGELEQRNMYQLALEAVSRAVDKGLLPAETWEIHCYGAQGHEPVVFSSGIKTVMLPSLDMAAYAGEIRHASLVLYLVLSPHTGYMPLEAAACGVPVVTNTYLNKSADYLRKISPLIIPACPTLDGVSDALATGLQSLAGKKRYRKKSMLPAIPWTWSKSFAPIMPKIQEWLQHSSGYTPVNLFEEGGTKLITKHDDIIRRWSPARRFLAPMIARMPSLFWPVSKAKALVAEGKVEEAKLVLEAYPENGRAQNLLEILHERERAEEKMRADHKQTETITNILSVPFPPILPSYFMRLFFHEPEKCIASGKLSHTENSSSDKFIHRLLKSYIMSSDAYINGLTSWETNFCFGTKADIHHIIYDEQDTEKLEWILSDPYNSDLWFGFHEPTSSRRFSSDEMVNTITKWDFDILYRLVEVMGGVCCECAENPLAAYPDCDELVHALEELLQISLEFPTPYPHMAGLQTCRGIVGHRALWGLYSAILMKRFNAQKVLEIGAGLGWAAYFAAAFGVTAYTIIDIPLTALASSHFLGLTRGEESIRVYGEHSIDEACSEHCPCNYTILPPNAFPENGKYDLVLNMDSLTEMPLETAEQYIKKIKKVTNVFISINHEKNPFTVVQILKNDPDVKNYTRNYFPLRKGYMEEVFIFGD